MRAIFLSILLFIAFVAPAGGQLDYHPPPDLEPIHRPYDKLLDDYVRDGIVYYHALQLDRAKLDRYLVALAEPSLASQLPSWDKPRQIAFWINAYNALSLQTA